MREKIKKLVPKRWLAAAGPTGHLAESAVLQSAAGFPTRGLKVIGVTGTDGKTTTSFYIYTMLKAAGYKVGLQTTVAYGAEKLMPNETHMTVVPTRQLLARIKAMKREGIEYLVLEVTSHSLVQHRVWGIPFHLAVWTNLSPEHLDYHGTFESYRRAKLKLFKLAAKNRRGLRLGIVNADDTSAPEFLRAIPRTITYGIQHGELRASQVKSTGQGSRYVAKYQDRSLAIETMLPAKFNVYNSLAATGVGLALGLSDAQIEQGIVALTSVAGRMNRVEAGQDFGVVIDFAHTPNAMQNVFRELRPLTKGRLIGVFGATGNRDKAKRPEMGRVGGQLCDIVIITEDDDGTEDGQGIMEAVAAGAERAGKVRDKDLVLIHDRREAIARAMDLAKVGDTVVLLGIGHQSTLNTNKGEIPWSEDQIARSAIAARLKAS